MTMHLAQGLSTISTKKRKPTKLTQKRLQELEVEWRQYNKRMRQKHCHYAQFKTLDDYIAYIRGQYKPKQKVEKEFKPYVPPQTINRNTKDYPSLTTSNAIPGSCAKKPPQQYTGDLIVGIATMHKSNAVPVMRGTKQAEDIAKMRR